MTVEFTSGDYPDLFEDVTAEYEAGFSAEHAGPANYGTDPHWPPLTPMLEWTNRMGWENPGLDESMAEGEMWDEVDRRRDAGERLPSAYHLAAHIAESGTEGLMFASDAHSEGVRNGESWVARQNFADDTPPDVIAKMFLNWVFETAQQNLVDRVSSASSGALLKSGYPAVEADGGGG